MTTLGALVDQVRRRLGDVSAAIWLDDEITLHVVAAYRLLANSQHVFYDWTYLENLPRVFSYTALWERALLSHVRLTIGRARLGQVFSTTWPWEAAYLTNIAGTSLGTANLTSAFERTVPGIAMPRYGPGVYTNTFEATNGHVAAAGLSVDRPNLIETTGGLDAGQANFTYEQERRLLGDERLRSGPANATSPYEASEGFLGRAGASTAIPATAELPATLTALLRATWSKRAIYALNPRRLQHVDSRYELTTGEVYGYLWEKDGLRTLRKVRVPGAQAVTITANGPWGLLRTPTDLSGSTVSGTWGVPRRIPGHHPIGPSSVGAPRRPYLEEQNVRVEHFRQGRALASRTDVCELPDRYALYLRDYAMGKCLERPGPGQDAQLAAHFAQRWTRGLARVTKRLTMVDRERTPVYGGDGATLETRPPRPKLPWNYGSVVR